jgi:hypothetical protein
MMVENGHADYSVLRAIILMFDTEPNLIEVRRMLTIVSISGVESATYFWQCWMLLQREVKTLIRLFLLSQAL